MFTIARPTVLLPQPDSPTSPNVSPLLRSKLTPSTALTSAILRANTPPVTGKRTNRSCTSSSFSILQVWWIHERAAHPVSGGILDELRLDLVARLEPFRTSRDELAGRWQIQNAGDVTRNGAKPRVLVALDAWQRCHQAASVRMQRILE